MIISPVALIGTLGMATALSRFLRRSSITEGLRRSLSSRSPLLEKLFSCPHCLGFWISVGCALPLARNWFEFTVLVLLGWRGAYHLNGLLDYLNARFAPGSQAPQSRDCQQCGAPWNSSFFKRQELHFCSYRCWFDYLKEQRQHIRQPDKPLFDEQGILQRQEMYPGSYREIDPLAVRKLFESKTADAYIDIRSADQFANGHPAGAINIPLFHHQAGSITPNPEFLSVVQAHFPHSASLLLGCQMGAHSMQAAEILLSAGYSKIAIVRGGFSGARDLAGQTIAPGWRGSGLPVEYGAQPGQSYESLVTGMKKRDMG